MKHFLAFNLIILVSLSLSLSFFLPGRLFIYYNSVLFYFSFEGIVVVIGGITFVAGHKFTPGTLYLKFISRDLI